MNLAPPSALLEVVVDTSAVDTSAIDISAIDTSAIDTSALEDSAIDNSTIDNSAPGSVLSPDRWVALARAALRAAGVVHGRLDLSFVDAETISELNQTHMDVAGPTDVLAFPIDAVEEFGVVEELDLDAGNALAADLGPNVQDSLPSNVPGENSAEAVPPVLLGDIVICLDVAASNAAAAKRGLDDELALLVVHGVLHVMGLDHAEAEERAAMQAMERQLLVAFHDPSPSTHWHDSTDGAQS